MAELHRLVGTNKNGYTITLILTDTHLQVEPSPEYRAYIQEKFQKGREEAKEAPKAINWVVEKALDFASRKIEEFLRPHPLGEVEVTVLKDKLTLKLGKVNWVESFKVPLDEAFIFDAKYRQALAALKGR